jgi:LacI family transcriptional regulator
VRQPTDQLARRAVELLFEKAGEPGDDAMSGTLIFRGSTGPPDETGALGATAPPQELHFQSLL